MQAKLLMMADCDGCDRAEAIWRKACDDRSVELVVLSVEDEPGASLARRLRVTTYPALVIEDEIVAVGVPGPDDATGLIDARQE